MTDRRAFLAGLLAASALPAPSWAEAGSPAFVTAAKTGQGYILLGLSEQLDELFRLPLPGRGHAAAAHPSRPEAVAFARRPGTFAVVLDCRDGGLVAQLTNPEGRHFYGHGAFSADGARLFTSENDYEAGQGVIGIWDVTRGYTRMGEVASGGIGPHELALMPGGQALVVANGGIDTHPESGRTKLNIPTMEPNLTYLSLTGDVLDQVELPQAMSRNSIRHLDVRRDGLVGFGMQWQGDVVEAPPLLATHRIGGPLHLADSDGLWRRMRGYVGSVCFSDGGKALAITSPPGGVLALFDSNSLAVRDQSAAQDVCGIASLGARLVSTTGAGEVRLGGNLVRQVDGLAFDNHLVPVAV